MISFKVISNGKSRGILDKVWDGLHKKRTLAEVILAEQIMKDTERFVPFQTGSLRARTHLEGHDIVYPGPYARFLYYGKRMVDSKTGRGPFYIPGVGYRYRKGAVLVATDKPLTYHTAGTCSHWIEASKAMNLVKWERVAERALKNAK